MRLLPGTRLGPYEILQPIGAGGMGEVYRARHEKLRRDVAIKVLPAELSASADGLARFEREARTASALNHPSIVTIHDIAEHDGIAYIAMELVDGRTLGNLVAAGPLPVDDALRHAVQLADALAKAHAAGIIHRDIKPANVMITVDGLAKILDFGIAKAAATADAGQWEDASLTDATLAGRIVGTPQHMAPEQLAGGTVDHRADQFAFGVLLYEMLAGTSPFTGPSLRAIVGAILTQQPPPLRQLRPDVPGDFDRIIVRCLAKDATARYQTTAELAAALRACAERHTRARHGLRALLRRPAVAGPLGALLFATVAAGGVWVRNAERRWAERDAAGEIERLTNADSIYEAYRVALVALRHRPDDPALRQLMERITLPIAVNTEPSGADVWVKGYGTPDTRWERLGSTPVQLRIPYAMMHWRITRSGYETFEGAPLSGASFAALAALALDPAGSRPADMVRVPGGVPSVPPAIRRVGNPAVQSVETFLLDRFEVTNRQYRAFVDAGGYDRPEFWPAPLVRDGRTLSWAEAQASFRDASGRPGPATWQLGRYPDGEGEHPVAGLSWFEAAAFCAFAGRSLPTIYHWYRALGQEQISDILLFSNMAAERAAPVGHFRGLGAYGTYDMAGNVKEWVWNATGDQRYILGGAWDEPRYMFRQLAAHDPWERHATFGVRCAAYEQMPADHLLAPVTPLRDFNQPEPISDDAFDVLRGVYEYDPTPLEPRIEGVTDDLPRYRRETVSVRTAYGNERMDLHFLIPHGADPPYQSVIWFPGGDVFLLRSSDTFSSAYLCDFVPDLGRVLIQPVYKGMYERYEEPQQSPTWRRDMVIRWSQDLARTIDYLETRDDFAADRVAFYGFSSGANFGPVFTAVDPRFAASILLGGGLTPAAVRPEIHAAHFAPRSRTPTLLISGEDDFMFPYEVSQRPLFDMLGVPADRKRHARLAGGHIPMNRLEIIREVNAWLDSHLGPVPARQRNIARSDAGFRR
jgi:eukaryotic-like serine/threonine-protein kinase